MRHSKSVLHAIQKLPCTHPTFIQIFIVGSLTIVTPTFFGCVHSASVASNSQAEAFDIQFVKGVRWTSDTLRYDWSLPGYHLTGGIGTIELRLKPDMHADGLVLEITTSPGAPPHLEGFTLARADTLVKIAPSSESDSCDLMVEVAENQWRTFSRRKTEDYVHFQTTDSSVMVSFMPLSLQLMTATCTITWVDWYRK